MGLFKEVGISWNPPATDGAEHNVANIMSEEDTKCLESTSYWITLTRVYKLWHNT